MPNKKVLAGYKKEGKRFISPMKQLPSVQEFSYVNDMLPELIWLGLIHERNGYQFGAKVLEVAIKVVKNWPKPENPTNYALQSAYSQITDEQKLELVEAWRAQGILEEVQQALAPLILLYDGFSLSFVGPPSEALSEQVLLQRIRGCVRNHLSKYETPGIVLNGTLLLSRMMEGTIKIAPHIKIPDLNAVITQPESDEAKKAAAFMRANAGVEMAMLKLDKEWPEKFWNRGASLSPCKYPEGFKNHG